MSASDYPQRGALAPHPSRPAWHRIGQGPREWRYAFARHHQVTVLTALAGLLILSCTAPSRLPASADLLLVAGAVIGVPHGSSDFVQAHRLFARRLRAWWLPVFCCGYLALVGAVLLGWCLVPAATLVAFLAISAFHFGAGPWDEHRKLASLLRWSARGLTPVLPIFLFHPGELAGILALLASMPAAALATLLEWHAEWLLLAYAMLLAVVVLAAVHDDGPRRGERMLEAVEIILLACAAWALPPLLLFAIFFCGIHAVRHIVDLGAHLHPRNGRAALGVAALIVVPSGLACCALLGLVWSRLAGVMSDTSVLCAGLRVVAALTVPHVALEWWATRNAAANSPSGMTGDRQCRG